MLDRRDYISLKKAAEATFCSANFLLKMIQEKQLKGFKMGSRWYTTNEWLNDFDQALQNEIREVANGLDQSESQYRWQPVNSPLILAVQSAFNIVLVVMLLIFWGTFVGGLNNKSEMVALTKRVVVMVSDGLKEHKISDESLTHRWQRIVSKRSGSVWGALGQVAGEFEEYKVKEE